MMDRSCFAPGAWTGLLVVGALSLALEGIPLVDWARTPSERAAEGRWPEVPQAEAPACTQDRRGALAGQADLLRWRPDGSRMILATFPPDAQPPTPLLPRKPAQFSGPQIIWADPGRHADGPSGRFFAGEGDPLETQCRPLPEGGGTASQNPRRKAPFDAPPELLPSGPREGGRRAKPNALPEEVSGHGPRVPSVLQPSQGQPTSPPTEPDRPSHEASRKLTTFLATPTHAAAERSENLELIAREADIHTRRGFELASRGAYFSARSEFVLALRVLAQALDAEHRTTVYSRALAAGLTALKEVDDFLPNASKLQAEVELADILNRHRTPVLKDVKSEDLTPLDAMQCYVSFAQEQLAAAVANELAGSMALHGLGKLYAALAKQPTTTVRAANPKAMVSYQAALLAAPRNYMASNDLGVLLARAGRYEDAKVALEHSLSIHQQSIAWHNLAVVFEQLGRTESARRALRLAELQRQGEASRVAPSANSHGGQIQWVDPHTFARRGGQDLPGEPSTPAPSPPLNRQAKGLKAAAGRNLAQAPYWNAAAKRK